MQGSVQLSATTFLGDPANTSDSSMRKSWAGRVLLASLGTACPAQCRAMGWELVTSSTAEYAANAPIEDRHHLNATAHAAAVFDGHGGDGVSEYASHTLPRKVVELIDDLDDVSDEDDAIGAALQGAFQATDEEWTASYHNEKYYHEKQRKAREGACALFGVLRGGRFYVANAGDSRAVLGRRGAGSWKALALSYDHNVREERERRALEERHPNEPDIVVCHSESACYIKGRLQPSRALGDLYLKLAELSPGGRRGHRWSAPYVTAEPEVTVRTLSEGDTFVVLASDGLWELLENDQVVEFIGSYLEKTEDEADLGDAAERLLHRALEVAAEEAELTVDELKAVPPGRMRRSLHDDITIVVLFLQPTAIVSEVAAAQ